MNVNVEFKDRPAGDKLRKLIDRLIRKLQRKLSRFGDETFLRVMVEENSLRRLYRVSINLELPKKTLARRGERHDADEAVRDAFAEIERQFEAYKAALRGEHEWWRRARREELRKTK